MKKRTQLANYETGTYNPGSVIKRGLWYICNRLFFNTSIPYPEVLKRQLLKLFGAKVGKQIVLKPRINIKYPWFLEIGDHTWIGEGVWIDNLARVSIGANACISQGAMILSGNHNYKSPFFELMLADILIEDGVWIGAKCLVTQGVRISSHAVVVVGSVVSTDLEPYSINRGNPAIKLKERHIL